MGARFNPHVDRIERDIAAVFPITTVELGESITDLARVIYDDLGPAVIVEDITQDDLIDYISAAMSGVVV